MPPPALPDPDATYLQISTPANRFRQALDPDRRARVDEALEAIRENPGKPDGINVSLNRLGEPRNDTAVLMAELPGHVLATYIVVTAENLGGAQKVVVKDLRDNPL